MIEVERPARFALVCLLGRWPPAARGRARRRQDDAARASSPASSAATTPASSARPTSRRATSSASEFQSDNPALRPNVFDPGPLFANAVVMDEINRATPKLQSALFEAMEERFVTVAKKRHALPRPFFVVATMNPHDSEETYHLPFGQRDRFALAPASATPARGESTCSRASAATTRSPTSTRSSPPGDVVKVQRGVTLVDMPDSPRVPRAARARHPRPSGRRGRRLPPRGALAAALLPGPRPARGLHRGAAGHVQELFVVCLAHRIQFQPEVNGTATAQAMLESIPAPAWKKPTLVVSRGRSARRARHPEPLSAEGPGRLAPPAAARATSEGGGAPPAAAGTPC